MLQAPGRSRCPNQIGNAGLLEIGYGSGVVVEMIAKDLAGGLIAGIDFSEHMVRKARRRNAAGIAAGKVELGHGDIASPIPYEDDFFDAVFSHHSLYYWSQPLLCFKELHRVLKPGGKIAVLVWTKGGFLRKGLGRSGLFRLYENEEVMSLFRAAGFEGCNFMIRDFRYAPAACVMGYKKGP